MTLEATRAHASGRPVAAGRGSALPARSRWIHAGLAGLLGLLCAAASQPPVHAAPATLSLTGTVCDRASGRPIPAAMVALGTQQAQADRTGTYRVQVPAASHYYMQASAQGHQATGFIVISNPSGGPLAGSASFSFCGGLSLLSAFRSADGGVHLTPFDLVRSARAPLLVTGTSAEPLEDQAALQRPDGKVDLIEIKRRGTGISMPLRFASGAGRYVLEINAGAGFALLKVPICIGRYVPPQALPDYSMDRPGASVEQLQSAALQEINLQRVAAHLPPLSSDARLTREAQAHSDDVMAKNYVMQHAHVGSDGSSPSDRIRKAGVSFEAMAEDIGTGSSIQEIVLDLMDSPAHRWAILGNFKIAGIGVARQGATLTLTVDFVR